MKSVFGLIKNDGSSVINHFIGYFFTPMSRQTVHHQGIILSISQQSTVNLIGGKDLYSLGMFLLLAHTGPNIGIDNICFFTALAGS